MLTWLWIIMALVIIAAVLGFGGLTVAAAALFKMFFWILLIIFVIGLIAGLMSRRRIVL